MKILAIGAHADDVELGCGGSLLKWAAEGHDITIYTASDSAYAAPDGTLVRSAEDASTEAIQAAKIIGATLITGNFKCFELAFAEPLNSELVSIVERVSPDMILCHWDGDTHPDHKNLALAMLHTSRRVPNVLLYRSNWYAGTTVFEGRYFSDISSTLEDKLDLVEIFQSEYKRTGGDWRGSIRDQATVLGREILGRYAEAFQIVRITDSAVSSNSI